MQRWVFSVLGVGLIAVCASALAEVTVSLGGHGALTDDLTVRSHKLVVASTSSPVVSVTPTPTATPVPAVAASTPSATPTATTNSFVHLRAAATTSSPILANLNGGTIVVLGAYVDSQWQQVSVDGQTGYVYKSYLTY